VETPSKSVVLFFFIKYMKLFDDNIELHSEGLFYLDDIMKLPSNQYYDRMMNQRSREISFLNKSECGNGGTTGLIDYALHNDKGLLVVVPNVSICRSKEIDFTNDDRVCCVYGGVDEINLDAQVVIATYDQFEFLKSKLADGGMTGDDFSAKFWGGRTVIVDEYHKLVSDSSYRKVCHILTDMVVKCECPVVFMSATPDWKFIQFIRDVMTGRRVVSYTVDYRQDHRQIINLVSVSKKERIDGLRKMLESRNNGHICVFYSCVKDIVQIIKQIGNDDIEVLCSSNSAELAGPYYSKEFNERKKMHFMTSAYFTGCDIKVKVDHFVIMGSCERKELAYSLNDIKQIIGRDRYKGEGDEVRMGNNWIWWLKATPEKADYQESANVNTKSKETLDFLTTLGEKAKDYPGLTECVFNYLRSKDEIERFKMWQDIKELGKKLKDYGFKIDYCGKLSDMEGFDTESRKKKLSFKETKKRMKAGVKVSFDENPDIVMMEAYARVNGMSKLLDHDTSKSMISNWYKVNQCVKGDKVDEIKDKEKLCELFGLKSFGRYNGGYLRACLGMLGVDNVDNSNIGRLMKEWFGVICLLWGYDDCHNRTKNSTFLCVYESAIFAKNRDQNTLSLYKEKEKKPLILAKIAKSQKQLIREINLGYEVGFERKHSYAATESLGYLVEHNLIPNLTRYPLYTWVMQDKPVRLPEVKKTDQWLSMKRFGQLKLSDMYNGTKDRYQFTQTEMDSADSLMVDIDEGLPFSKFKELYGDWTWCAYPSISNTENDWIKFRVIIPLSQTIRLKGSNRSKVMRLLRSYFTSYEDPNHQLYSYVNINDFTHCIVNEGDTWDISQELVDDLTMCVDSSVDYTDTVWTDKRKEDIAQGLSQFKWDLDKAERKWLDSYNDPEEGARHYGLYSIKLNLSPEDRDKFRNWLSANYPKYVGDWDSHRI
jgi:hypothetical protein